MAQQTFDPQSLLHRVYTESKNVLGANNIFQRLFPFQGSKKPGEELDEQVWYTNIHGATKAGRIAAPTLRKPVAAEGVNPRIKGSQIFLRSEMGTLAHFNTVTSEQAYERAVTAEKRQLDRSADLYVELAFIYDRSTNGLAKVEAVDDVNKSITVKAETWSPAMLAQLINAPVDLVLPTVANNVVTAYTPRAGAADLMIKRIVSNKTTRKIFFHNPQPLTGAVPDLSLVVLNDIMIFNTSLTAGVIQEAVGLLAISRQDAGINHAGVDIANVYQMQPNYFDAEGNVPDARLLLSAMELVIDKGGHGDFYACVPTPVFRTLAQDTMAFRRLDQSYNSAKFVNGVRGIQYEGQAGILTVTPHPYMMDGDMVIVPVKETPPAVEGQEGPDLGGMNIRRIGEVERAYGYPGGMTMQLPILQDKAASEQRVYTCQAPWVTAAGHITYINNFALTRYV